MKRVFYLLMTAILAGVLFACGEPATVSSDTPAVDTETTETPEVVVFADAVLEAGVREAMNKPDGDITVAEAEAVTELHLSTDYSPDEPEEGTVIKDLNGLECFKNLENLELNFHSITDLTPLAGLTSLRSLGLGGNPISDLTPLSGLTNLQSLALFNCQAEDYGPLANLVNLESLYLEYSSISDLTPLSGLMNLQRLSLVDTLVSDVSPISGLTNLISLSLSGCSIDDYTPLSSLYRGLEEKDFLPASSLEQLGFTMDESTNLAGYGNGTISVNVNHPEWGETSEGYEFEASAVTVYWQTDSGYHLITGYYPDAQTYCFGVGGDDKVLTNYFYDPASGEFTFGTGDRASAEEAIRVALGETDAEDILTAPIALFQDILIETFGMTADELYSLPMAVVLPDRSTLIGLGFIADEDTASYLYESQTNTYYSVQVKNSEWGSWDEGGDIRFFTPLSDEYRIVVTYYNDEGKFLVKTDDNDGGGAAFEFFIDTNEHIDGWCSDETITVEEYFVKAFDDPGITDIYLHAVELMTNYIEETFGMSVEELYAMPVGA